ncbi:unnamed protein product [Protopolystoma xenopodis]|uniref:Uncharacterized protein n=1 Tax=Protopolystoma xenopodis TaxID=117903 RepID=A0A448XI66_9PLAT|nr:unnamed protein product [Protopolystoma xenopodis]
MTKLRNQDNLSPYSGSITPGALRSVANSSLLRPLTRQSKLCDLMDNGCLSAGIRRSPSQPNLYRPSPDTDISYHGVNSSYGTTTPHAAAGNLARYSQESG